MAISYLLKINSTDITDLVKYELGRNKLWADSTRAMSGKLKATLIGIFPKIEIETNYLTAGELKTLSTLLDNAQFTLEYWDYKSGGYKTGEYYASDYKVAIHDKEKETFKPFKVSLVPYEKES